MILFGVIVFVTGTRKINYNINQNTKDMNTATKLAQIARANQKKNTPDTSPFHKFHHKVRWASHQYVRYVKTRCKEIAIKGYGSVEIKLDKTTDIFNVDEHRNSCYSAEFVIKLLNNEGFIWKNEPTDYYDAVSDVIIWDKDLPQAPQSEKIGMSWK